MGQIKNIKLHIVTDIKKKKYDHMSWGEACSWRKSKVSTGKFLYRERKRGAARQNARELAVTEKLQQMALTKFHLHQAGIQTRIRTNIHQVRTKMHQIQMKKNRRT